VCTQPRNETKNGGGTSQILSSAKNIPLWNGDRKKHVRKSNTTEEKYGINKNTMK
jgi:hypothetical protein